MFLVSAEVGPFKSIGEPQRVDIGQLATVFVGTNESGKTVFLQALEKSADVTGSAQFAPVDDYPRRRLPPYLRRHGSSPERVTKLTYQLTPEEVRELSTTLQTEIQPQFNFSISCKYNNRREIGVAVDEISVVRTLASQDTLSSDARGALATVKTIRDIPNALNSVNLAEPDEQFVAGIQERIEEAAEWDSVLSWEAWQWLSPRTPKFLYFGDYNILPSKMNLTDLMERAQQAKLDSRATATNTQRGPRSVTNGGY